MKALLASYERHEAHVATRARSRRDAVGLRSVVDDQEGREAVTVQESLGKWQPGDELQGDVNFRTLRSLLKLVDEAGFERSPHQVRAPQFSGPPCRTDPVTLRHAHSSSSTPPSSAPPRASSTATRGARSGPRL